ncbi:MAG: 50S ribosomal protein L10 [Candidatus Omnitrophota bacterium]
MQQAMQYSRTCKDLMERDLEKKFKEHGNFIITNYIGLKATDLNEFRHGAKKIGSIYLVVKNKLGTRVLERLNLGGFSDMIQGGCGIVFAGRDIVQTARYICENAKKFEVFTIKGAHVEGRRLSAADVKELATLPSREVLLAKAFSAMKSPISGFVNVLGGVLRNFVYVVSAIKEQKEKGKTS